MTIGYKIVLTCAVLVTLTLVLATASLISIGGLSADIERLQLGSGAFDASSEAAEALLTGI